MELLGRFGDSGGHAKHHFGESATTLLPLQSFPLSNERLQDFTTGRQPFACQGASPLVGHEFQHTVCESTHGRACSDFGQLWVKFLGSPFVVAVGAEIVERYFRSTKEGIPIGDGIIVLPEPS